MNLKNITLKTAELGPVEWNDVEKLQPSINGFICFISADTITKVDNDGVEYTALIGNYIQTPFDHAPSYKEMINYIIQQEYPNGKEAQLLRIGVHNPNDKEYLDYYSDVEQIAEEVKQLLA